MPLTFVVTVNQPGGGGAPGISVTMLGLAWIGLALAHAVLLRDLDHGGGLVFAVLLGTFVGDTGAYLGGRAFGQRKLAPTIYRQLSQAVEALRSGVRDYARIEAAGRAALDGAGFRTDYFTVRDARTLAPARPDTKQFVVLTAARLGKARLIDNVQFQV